MAVKRRGKTDTNPQAKYDAAGNGRRIASWNPPASGPRAATEGTEKLRNRARDSARNDWAASSSSQRWVTNLVGVGIRPRFKRIPEGPRRQYLVDLFDDWVPTADADGVLDFYGLQTLGVRAWFDSGEVFLRLRPRRLNSPLEVPLQVQLVESDYVPQLNTTSWPGLPAGNEIRQGIELDGYGRRVAYWMHREHPGDAGGGIRQDQLVRVPAAQVRHVFEPTRPGQLRGVSQLASVLVRLRMGGDLEDVVLDRQRLANLFVAWITKQMPPDWEDIETDSNTGLPLHYSSDGRALSTMSAGTTQELAPGENVTFANPPEAGISHSDYLRTVNMGTAAGNGLPYEIMSGDIRGVSDRTLRVIILEFRRLARQRQWQIVIPMLCQPVMDAWVTAAVLAQRITPAEAKLARRVEWAPEGWEHIHPMQDPQGKILEIEAGLRSRSSVIGERGDDPGQIDQERADDQARAERLNLSPQSPAGAT